ncbi:bacterial low temperature requirement A protein-domain-containing protein [Phycomyces blakesleeanus]|uniref:Bacterial low temperature requirement A protein-domain-containing protein n=1 Tax=Phycomyces blakesleeanus TaxID=4837 RepID=A0ABR3ASC7_PHYBL
MSQPSRSSTINRSVRRGPTLRSDRSFRPPIGRLPIPRTLRRGSQDECQSLTSPSSPYMRTDSDLDFVYEEKEEYRPEQGQPVYHHGDETFGDIITHPIEQLQAHRQRRQEYEGQVHTWEDRVAHDEINPRELETGLLPSTNASHPQEEYDYIIVVHFRQLRGNQSFVLDLEKANEFSNKINLTPQERVQFNGVRDTDGLTAFLYKTRREFSIKIHHKAEISRSDNRHSKGDLSHHAQEHDPNHHTIEFNENVYVEFKPVYYVHSELPVQATRRPFFQHPEPDLSADIGEEKAASWLELFYDLFYVATLTEFTHTHVIKDWESLGLYTSWFVITWWAWTASSLYTARFDTDDVLHHIWKLIEMCAVIGMAGTSDHFLNSRGYVYGYLVLKAVLVLEYSIVFVVALMARSKSRLALSFYVGANVISMIIWGCSLLIIDKEIHRLLWYLGVLAELLVNVIVRGDKTLSWAASHLAERLGLLSLIVLGENLMGLVKLVAESGTDFVVIVPNFMAVVIIFGFFFMYFEDFNKEVFLHSSYHQVWVYLHFPLHLCQVAFGIALINTLVVYRHQMVQSGRLVKGEGEEEESEEGHSTAGSGTESSENAHGAAESSANGAAESSTHGTTESGTSATTEASDHSTPETSSQASHETAGQTTAETPTHSDEADAYTLAQRAIEETFPHLSLEKRSSDSVYEPSGLNLSLEPTDVHSSRYHASGGFITMGKQFVATVVFTALQAVSIGGSVDQLDSSSGAHHFQRRSIEVEEELTDNEKVFIYKTFLICGGFILVINSFIKLLNTKVTDIYGKIIVTSRVINAIVLWSMCALSFASLDAFVLLSVMMGSLIFQGKNQVIK